MNFAIGCLSLLAIFANVSSAPDPGDGLRFDLYPLFYSPRITDGQNAVHGDHPYQISLQWRRWSFSSSQHICGGSLISDIWIVTAAHCFTNIPGSGYVSVIAGKHNIHSNNERNQQTRDVRIHILHSLYQGGVNPHDIALVRVASPFNFDDYVSPIKLPSINHLHTGNAVISGWGSTSLTTTPNQPIFLQTANVPIINTTDCYNVLTNVAANPPLDQYSLENICTGSPEGSRFSVCSGDSGGPLAQKLNEDWELVGIISWAVFPCGMIGAPSVYVRTSAYVDWINEHIALNS